MARYRKRPIVIEAEQFFYECTPWPEGVLCDRLNDHVPVIKTLEGQHLVSEGDWIITGIQGERYPCKPDIFEATYEKVQ